MARRVARDVADYDRSGLAIVGSVGVGDSPSCGVFHTLDLKQSLPVVASLDVETIDRLTFNERAVRAYVVDGEGMFMAALRRQLSRRGLNVPFFEEVPSDVREDVQGSGTAH